VRNGNGSGAGRSHFAKAISPVTLHGHPIDVNAIVIRWNPNGTAARFEVRPMCDDAHAASPRGKVSGPPIAGRCRTMLSYIPSLAALQSNDDGRLTAELRLARLRSQVAIIRSLADHVEHLARPQDTDGLSGQLVEEMARLGCLLLETAGALTTVPPHLEDSGVFSIKLPFRPTEVTTDSPVASDPGASGHADSPHAPQGFTA
jgi:hypothetical protein